MTDRLEDAITSALAAITGLDAQDIRSELGAPCGSQSLVGSWSVSVRCSTLKFMTHKAHEVYQAGLELDPDERTVVAHRLLASLRPEDSASQPEIDAAWRDEIGSRVDDVLNGKVELSTFEQSRANAQALLDSLRR